MRVGFSNLFPPKPGSETDVRQYQIYVPRYHQWLTVSVSKVTLIVKGEKEGEQWEFAGINTSREKLQLRAWESFGSHCYIEEGEAMAEAAEKYAAEMKLEIGTVYNNWPEFRAGYKQL